MPPAPASIFPVPGPAIRARCERPQSGAGSLPGSRRGRGQLDRARLGGRPGGWGPEGLGLHPAPLGAATEGDNEVWGRLGRVRRGFSHPAPGEVAPEREEESGRPPPAAGAGDCCRVPGVPAPPLFHSWIQCRDLERRGAVCVFLLTKEAK